MTSNKTAQTKALPGSQHTNLKYSRVERDPSVLAFGGRWRAQGRKMCVQPPGSGWSTAGLLIAVVGL